MRKESSVISEIKLDSAETSCEYPARGIAIHAWRPYMGESRIRAIGARRRWAIGLAVSVPLALAVSQAWVAHATVTQSAITPVRALDSRSNTAFHLSPSHQTDIWQVTGANGIPAGATALVLNLTVVNATAT